MLIHSMFNIFKVATAALLMSMSMLASSETSFDDEINTLMEPWSNSHSPGAAIAVRVDGQRVFEGGYGLANLEYGTPMTSDTPSRVASISKQFTAFATLLLVDSGKLTLDTDIHTLLPEMQTGSRPILVRHLLDHISGLRDESTLASMAGWHQDDAIIEDQVFNLVAQQTGLNFEPETEYQYNNSNFFLLAKIVERVSGQSFSKFTQEHLFQPLEMNKTWFVDDRFKVIKDRAYSYYPAESGFSNARLNSEVLGSAGLMTTASDLILWAENFETKKVGSDRVHQWMAERATTFSGADAVLAKGQEKRRYDGDILWCHGGRNGGFRSFLVRVPAKKLAISVLANRADFDMAKIAYDILAIISPADSSNEPEPEPETPSSFDGNTLDTFTGDFELFKGLVFSFKVAGEALLFSTNQMDAWVPLQRVAHARFLLNEADNTFIEFNLSVDAWPTSIDYVISENGRLTAPRVVVADLSKLDVNLKDFEGEYWSDELNTKYVVEIRGGRLFAIHQRSAPIELFLSAQSTFDARSNNFMQLEFVADKTSKVYAMRMSHAVSNDVWFDRVKRM